MFTFIKRRGILKRRALRSHCRFDRQNWRRKSTCANVLADAADLFKTSDRSISQTKDLQSEIIEVNWSSRVYKVKIVDTIGFGDSGLPPNEVLRRIGMACHKCHDGINAVYFVVKDRFTTAEADAWEMMSQVLFGQEIVRYTTIVRTNFEDFEHSEATIADIRALKKEGGEAATKILPGIQHFMHVNNSSLRYGDIARAERASSRTKLLTHLIDNCEVPFLPPLLREVQQSISQYAQEVEEGNKTQQQLRDELEKCKDELRSKDIGKELEAIKRKQTEANTAIEKKMEVIMQRGLGERALGAIGRFVDVTVGAGVQKLTSCSVM